MRLLLPIVYTAATFLLFRTGACKKDRNYLVLQVIGGHNNFVFIIIEKDNKMFMWMEFWAQVNFSGPETFSPKFRELLKLRTWQQGTV